MHPEIKKVIETISKVILGKEREIRLVFTCLLAEGHLLIEDIPGVGKTTLAQALARSVGLSFRRIQFTSDLLPADVIGVSIFNQEEGRFHFHPGPVFSNMLLADELNRTTPRTQSALLEAMEERQVSADGGTYPLPLPFFVIATQNQRYHIGTFPLPESQLDRFLMRIQLGYPDPEAERTLLLSGQRQHLLAAIVPAISPARLLELQQESRRVHVAAPILDYLQALLAASRSQPQRCLGLSPRAGMALLRSAQAWAFSSGREMVIPEDVQAVAGAVLEHRLDPEGGRIKGPAHPLTDYFLADIKVP